MAIPQDLEDVLDAAWRAASKVPGYLTESEARFLGLVAACAPATGAIVEIGSFMGKSTVMMAKVSQHYGLGPVVAIDPHSFACPEFQSLKKTADASSYQDFLGNLKSAEVAERVDPRRAYSSEVAKTWDGPIRFLWIDGDHTYRGAGGDFDGFFPHLAPRGIVAFHDALHDFSGPIQVFVEKVLRSDRFGASGFVGSIAWSQYRPQDGESFRGRRRRLDRVASRLIPFVKDGSKPRGIRRMFFRVNRSMVPRRAVGAGEWASALDRVD